MGALGDIFSGPKSQGPTAEEVKAQEEQQRRQTLAAAQSRARSRSSRLGTNSLTSTPTSSGLNIPGGNI